MVNKPNQIDVWSGFSPLKCVSVHWTISVVFKERSLDNIGGFQVTSESYGFLRLLCGDNGCHIDLSNDRCETTLFGSDVTFVTTFRQ